MQHSVLMSRDDISKELVRLVTDKISAHLTFQRGEVLTGRVFKVTSFEDGVAIAITDDESLAIQFALEDLTCVEVVE